MPAPPLSQEKTAQIHNIDLGAMVYCFLAIGMREPTAETITDDYLVTMMALLSAARGPVEEITPLLSDPHRLTPLQVEYTRLFINGSPHVIAPPYASVYMDGDGSIQGKTTAKTRDFMRARGFTVTQENEPVDHLSLELEFLGRLCEQGMYADEKLFLTTLFRPWFSRFYQRVLPEVRHPFYRLLIQLID